MFKKILIANRGEIAVRVIRACHELGIQTVAIHSEADVDALHVRLADEAVCIGPAPSPQSYLNIPAIIAAAEISKADAIHPGYGFLSENADFAQICEQCGLTFIGPTADNMRAWGGKVPARALAKSLGLPMLPGSQVLRDVDHALEEATRIGFPVILKASAGGGGRGMKIVQTKEELIRLFPQAKHEALVGFKNDDIYLERYVEYPRHIEFQVLCDGDKLQLVLGERECSIQRRHQKVIEEAPSLMLTDELRKDMSSTLLRAMKESNYRSAGTVEFLYDNGQLYFMEMNTRVQVEHPVTEMVMGIDIVCEQIRLAAGKGLSFNYSNDFKPRGHAIECRINAEDPVSFAPWPGLIETYHPPGGMGIRIDSGVYGGYRVPNCYDSMIAKVIAYGRNRDEAIQRMKRALGEMLVTGIRTNIPLHRQIMDNPRYKQNNISTKFLAEMLGKE